MPQLELHPAAAEEVEEAYAWYQREASGAIAEALLGEIDRALEAIREMPDTWPTFIQGTRRFVLHRFPYIIVYRRDANAIRVVAVAHQRRRPGYWRTRLQQP